MMTKKDIWGTNTIKNTENSNGRKDFSNKGKEVAENLSMNEIQKKSLEIANKKLEKIMDPTYKDFSVRFVNIEEYKKIIKENKFRGEVYVVNADIRDPDRYPTGKKSFSEYLKWGLYSVNEDYRPPIDESWINTINYQTKRPFAYQTLQRYSFLQKLLRKSKEMTVFRNKILKLLNEEEWKYLDPRNEQDYTILEEFKKNKKFLDKEGNLRKLVNALAYVSLREKQYHIALIIDSSVVDYSENPNRLPWGTISYSTEKEKVENSLLAAIAVMPNKELWNEMIGLSANAGKLAHPIFSRTGELKWPKKK